MEFKHIVFLVALLLILTVGRALCRRNAHFRNACAFLLVLGTTRSDLFDINFISREWYRGTTRGIEVSWLDLLWLLLLSSLPKNAGRNSWLPALGPMLVFFGYNALIVAYSNPAIFGVFELSKMARQIGVFITIGRYARSDDEIMIIAWALATGVTYEFFSATYQRIMWHMPRTQGTFGHANVLSMYELMAVPVLAAISLSNAPSLLRRACGVSALLGTITVLLTVSRTGIATMAVIGVFILAACGSLRKITAKHIRWGALLGCVLSVGLASTWGDFASRFESEGLDKEYGGNEWEGRGAYLILAKRISAREPLGCGLNNWSWCVSNRYGPLIEQYYSPYVGTDAAPPKRRLRRHAHIDAAQAAPAHSLYAITLGETGWPGVVLFAIVWIRWFMLAGASLVRRSAALKSRIGLGVFGALIGALGQSFSEWEIRLTPLAFLLHILLGCAAAVRLGTPTKSSANALT